MRLRTDRALQQIKTMQDRERNKKHFHQMYGVSSTLSENCHLCLLLLLFLPSFQSLSLCFSIILHFPLIMKSHKKFRLQWNTNCQGNMPWLPVLLRLCRMLSEKKVLSVNSLLLESVALSKEAASSTHPLNTTAGADVKTAIMYFCRELQTHKTFLLSCSGTPPRTLEKICFQCGNNTIVFPQRPQMS